MNHSKFIATAIATVLGAALPVINAQAAQYTKQEKEAIAAVQGFYDALNARDAAGGESKLPIRPIVEKYIAPNYHQNNPGMAAQGQGPEALIRMFGGGGGAPRGAPPGAGAPPAGGQPARGPGVGGKAPKVRYIGAVGNLVLRVSELGTTGLIFNMFTVENGKLVEHWDASMGGGMGGGGRQGGGAGGPGGPPGAGGPPGGFPAGGPPGAGGPPPGGQ